LNILDKKERSAELNTLERILIDFKSVINEKFIIYKKDNIIYYIFDENGFSRIIKSGDFLKIENFLDDDQSIEVNYKRLKGVTSLKKSEVTKISYDSENFIFETLVEEKTETYVIKKEVDSSGIIKRMVALTSRDLLNSSFIRVERDKNLQLLRDMSGEDTYPFNISFSHDIIFKLKMEESLAQYFLRPLVGSSFIEVVTTIKYSEVYEAQSILLLFNYFKKTE
jgi:hypothetical protein